MNERPLSIADFLTDGSLAALCRALGEVTNTRVSLHDEQGRRIVHTSGTPPWRIEAADDLSAQVAQMVREGPARVPSHSGHIEPLRVAGRSIGAIVVERGPAAGLNGDLERVREIVGLLSSAVNEVFEHDVLLRQRNAELSILFRLSSLLVEARDVETVLQVALRSSIEVLGVDAGTIHLYDDERQNLVLRAHTGLSTDSAAALRSMPAAIGSGALSREADAPVRAQGFEGGIAGDMVFRGRSLGVLRLFGSRAVRLESLEQALFQSVNEQVSAAVASARLIESERRAREVQRQVRLAAEVQRRMLPRVMPSIQRLDIAARYIPSFDLGGDFYDLIDLGGHLGVAAGDVVGKGVPAAMLMASVRASLRAHASDLYDMDEVISRVNRALVRDTLPNEFATLFYGVINPGSLRLTYCNAGHDPPLLVHGVAQGPPSDGNIYELTAGGMAIGIDAGQKYERGMFDLHPGDTFVAYTDGVVDARTFSNEKFGRPRLRRAILDALSASTDATAQAVADHIVWEVRRFIGLNPPPDDQTIVVVRVRR